MTENCSIFMIFVDDIDVWSPTNVGFTLIIVLYIQFLRRKPYIFRKVTSIK